MEENTAKSLLQTYRRKYPYQECGYLSGIWHSLSVERSLEVCSFPSRNDDNYIEIVMFPLVIILDQF